MAHQDQTRLSDVALLAELEQTDEALLALLQRRLGIARQVGVAKARMGTFGLRLDPAREAERLDHWLSRSVDGTDDDAIAGLWREVAGWSLACQKRLEVSEAPHTSCLAFSVGVLL